MSRSFTAEYLYTNNIAFNEQPLTFSCWFYLPTGSPSGRLIGMGGATGNHYSMWLNLSNSKVRIMTQTSSNSLAETTTTWSYDTWHHACGVVAATNNRSVYLDGGGKNTDTGNISNPTCTRTVIGRRGDLFDSAHTGYIAESAIWNAALSDAEVAALATGIRPLLVRPVSLQVYVPLIRDADKDIIAGFSFTASGSPGVVAHPRIILTPPEPQIWSFLPTDLGLTVALDTA